MSRQQSVLVLCLMAVLERMSYYGFRALIVVYAIDESGLNLNRELSLQLNSIFLFLLVFLPIPLGILTDKFSSQTKAIYLGGCIALIGYILLIFVDIKLASVGMLMIAAGTSLVKPNSTILIGRLFEKSNKKRSLAYIILFAAINIGAFIGSIAIGYIVEYTDWSLGFGLAAAANLIYLLIFHFTNKKINQIESNNIDSETLIVSTSKSILVLTFLLIINAIFWTSHSYINSQYTSDIISYSDSEIFGISFSSSLVYSIGAFFSIPLMLIFYLYWFLNGVKSTILNISKSLIFFGVAILFIFFSNEVI